MSRFLLFVVLTAVCLTTAARVHASAPGDAGPGAMDRTSRADPTHIDPAERPGLFIVGRISVDPQKTLPRIELMANYIARHLSDAGYRQGAGVVVDNEAEMIRHMREGRIDMVSESALSALRIADATGAEIALREWKNETAVYRSVIVVAKSSPIYTIEDLRGRRVALQDRDSTTGFLMPLAALRAAGLPVVKIGSPADEVPGDSVGYVLAGGELNISTWTVRGIVDGGGYSDLDLEDGDRTPKRVRNNLRLLYLSPPVIRSVVLIRPGLRPDVRQHLLDTLLAIGGRDDARNVRERYYKLDHYDLIDAAGHKSLDDVRSAILTLGPLLQ